MKRILFLQLPRLDVTMRDASEEVGLAARTLAWAVSRRAPSWEPMFLPEEALTLDDGHLLEEILDAAPDAIAATLYLWNVERTLALFGRVREALPRVRILLGGPEVSGDHPFLLGPGPADALALGEGEALLPGILETLAGGRIPDLAPVLWAKGDGYVPGRTVPEPLSLADCLPPPAHPSWAPDPRGMAYLETGRGCLKACSYCRYAQGRPRPSYLPPKDVLARVQRLLERGAREIRFVDPTLNAHPRFEEILLGLEALTRGSPCTFFGEIHPESLTGSQITRLRDAGFTEVEIGVQSRDPQVLRNVFRGRPRKGLDGIVRALSQSGLKVTLDLMYGLPGQEKGDVLASLVWAMGFGGPSVQCLQTLLLPGTRLRREKDLWGMEADALPPYAVRATRALSWEEMREIEETLHAEGLNEAMTGRFVGRRLKGLFPERVTLTLPMEGPLPRVPGRTSRRALLFRSEDLYRQTPGILGILRKAVKDEPHILWQFVLFVSREEPLNLLEAMIAELQTHPELWVDRFTSVSGWQRRVSRRLYVQILPGRVLSRDWIRAAEDLLRDHFY